MNTIPDYSNTFVGGPEASTMVGSRLVCSHSHCVLIGTELVSDHDYQVKIGNAKVSISRQMTPAEFQVLYATLVEVLHHRNP